MTRNATYSTVLVVALILATISITAIAFTDVLDTEQSELEEAAGQTETPPNNPLLPYWVTVPLLLIYIVTFSYHRLTSEGDAAP